MVGFVTGCVFLWREALAQWQCVGQLRGLPQEGNLHWKGVAEIQGFIKVFMFVLGEG